MLSKRFSLLVVIFSVSLVSSGPQKGPVVLRPVCTCEGTSQQLCLQVCYSGSNSLSPETLLCFHWMTQRDMRAMTERFPALADRLILTHIPVSSMDCVHNWAAKVHFLLITVFQILLSFWLWDFISLIFLLAWLCI